MNGGVFDWDGTLADIDEREFYCINEALRGNGAKTISHDFYVQNYYCRPFEVGTGPRMVLEAALVEDKARLEDVYETYRRLFAGSVDKAKLQAGALELLQVLKRRGLKIGIATMRFTRSVVEAELESLGVAPYADILLTREDLGLKRTLGSLEETVEQRVRLVTRALDKLEIGTRESFLVGDSWWDIRAGRQLGMKTVLVLTGFSLHSDFSSEEPSLTVGSLSELESRVRAGKW